MHYDLNECFSSFTGPGPLRDARIETDRSSLTITLEAPSEGDTANITFNARIRFVKPVICVNFTSEPHEWQTITGISDTTFVFTSLLPNSIYLVEAWTNSTAGDGPVHVTQGKTAYGGEKHLVSQISQCDLFC